MHYFVITYDQFTPLFFYLSRKQAASGEILSRA